MRSQTLDGQLRPQYFALVLCAALSGCGAETGTHEEHNVLRAQGLPPRVAAADDVEKPATPTYEGPKLVVVLVASQMRADVLADPESYRSGLATLLRDGLVFRNAFNGHGLPESLASHASLATGRYPSGHGLVGAEFLEGGKRVRATASTKKLVGAGSERTGEGPDRYLLPAIGDQLQAGHAGAKVYAIGLDGPRVVALGGRKPTGAFWYDRWSGDYVSSEEYGEALPPWLATYNTSDHMEALMREPWTLLREPAYYADRARPDEAAYEFDGVHVSFPHALPEGALAKHEAPFRPVGDRLSLEVAQKLIAEEGLGGDAVPDLLFVDLAAGGNIVSRYGPRSVEAVDYYANLDRLLGRFMGALDKRVGAENWVLVLTSESGSPPLPEASTELDLPAAARVTTTELLAASQGVADDLAQEEGIEAIGLELVPAAGGFRVTFPDGLDPARMAALRTTLAGGLAKLSTIADAFSRDELGDSELSGRMYLSEMRRGFHPARSPDILLRLDGSAYLTDEDGTRVMGGPYPDDSNIAVLARVTGLEARAVERPVFLVDLAPTLSRIFGLPDDETEGVVRGAPIPEILGQEP